MSVLLAVFVGGMLGAYARFRTSGAVLVRARPGFPWGTLAVNVAGSLALGLLLPHLAEPTPLRAFAAVGFLGAFTTFSTFAAEAVVLARDGRHGRAAGYVAASLGLAVMAVAAGAWLGGRLL